MINIKVGCENEFQNALSQKESIIEITNSFNLTKQYNICYKVTITSNSSNEIVLSRDNQSQSNVFTIRDNVTFENITFQGDNNSYKESFIITEGTLNLKNVIFEKIKSTCEGSVLCITEKASNTTINSSEFNNCQSTNNGGVIYNYNKTGFLTINYSKFNNNSSKSGGAIYSEPGNNINLNSCGFYKNQSTLEGGSCVINKPKSLLVESCNFSDNKSFTNGGALYIIVDETLTDFNIIYTTFGKNCSLYNGGAIYIIGNSKANIKMERDIITLNEANEGGAIYLNNVGSTNMYYFMLDENKATNGGAIYIDKNNTCDITKLLANDNESTNNGGVIYIKDNPNTIININGENEFKDNKAIKGKDIYNGSKINIKNKNIFASGIHINSTNNILNIKGSLEDSLIEIEKSDHVNKENPEILLALATEEYPNINDSDLECFNIPKEELKGWGLTKTENNKKIIIKDLNVYKIKYLNEKESENPNPLNYKKDDLPIDLKSLILSGYKFLGWKDEKGNITNKIDNTSNGNRTFLATWQEVETKKIIFDDNSETEVTDMPSLIETPKGENIVLPDNIPKRKGYLFLHWNKDFNDEGTKYYPKESIINVSEDITLYAIWYKIPIKIIKCCTECVCVCCKCKHKLNDCCNCFNCDKINI